MASKGFTLAEMLITLALIGLIAAIVIPKLLSSGENRGSRSKVLQAAQTISQAFLMYEADKTVKQNTSMADLLPYFSSYTPVSTSASLDRPNPRGGGVPSVIDVSCSSPRQCIRLPSGEYYSFYNHPFGSMASNRMISILVDVDGSPTTNGRVSDTNNSIWLLLYTTGKVRSSGNVDPGSVYTDGTSSISLEPCTECDPTWFDW